MKSSLLKTGTLSLILFTQLNLTGCASMVFGFSAEPITATVIDAETRQPLEGVIIVAHWQLVEGGFLDSSVPAGELMVMESVTNSNGVFNFPEWGPKYEFTGRLHNSDPELILFKPGYRFKVLVNQWEDLMDHKSVRTSDWNGKTIKMEKFEESLEKYSKHLSILDSELEFATHSSKDCEWKNTIKMISALLEQKTVFNANGVNSSIIKISEIPARDCGDPADYFRSNK